jgi:predicted nucleic acid-binding protein
LTAYDACHLALAEKRRTVVVTADERILAVGEEFARSLGTSA